VPLVGGAGSFFLGEKGKRKDNAETQRSQRSTENPVVAQWREKRGFTTEDTEFAEEEVSGGRIGRVDWFRPRRRR
jgi:hypothetical protein